MKRAFLFLLILSFLLTVPVSAISALPETSAKAMILWQPDTDTVLAEKNADEPMLIASTTKLLTALTAVRFGDLSAETTIRPEWTDVEGSRMYLKVGECYTLRELLTGLLLCSGNDAALAVAGTVSGDTETFAARMNDVAAELGMKDSHFINPHGLNAEGHVSTARDLARLMKAVEECDPLREILSCPSADIHGVSLENHNKLLGHCPGVFAGKTGYTKAAGRCLVSCCERDGWTLICVTLSDPQDWDDHAALYDWGYANYSCESVSELCPKIYVPVISGAEDSVLLLYENTILCHPRDEEVRSTISAPPFLFAPVSAGTIAGEAVLETENGERTVCHLYIGENVQGRIEQARRWAGEVWM